MRNFLIRLAILNVFQRKVRALLTIGGIAISISIMVFLFGLGMGLQALVTEQIEKTGMRDVITVSSKNNRQLMLDQATISQIQSITGVSNVEGVMNVSGNVTYNGVSLVLPIYAVTQNYFELSPIKDIKGDSRSSLNENSSNIIVSKGALEAFNGQEDIVGKQIQVAATVNKDNAPEQAEGSKQLKGSEFTVTGIVDRGVSPVAYVPASFLQQNGATTYSEVKVLVSLPDKVGSIRESIEQMGYQTNNIQDSIGQVERIFKVIRSILVLFGIVTVLITIFGTINTITIQLVEETKQVGFLRIMGIKNEHVAQLFILQSIILSTLGTLIGVLLGLVVGFASNGLAAGATLAAAQNEAIIQVFKLPIAHIIVMLILSVLLGWVIGLSPAKLAVKINPLDAIRS